MSLWAFIIHEKEGLLMRKALRAGPRPGDTLKLLKDAVYQVTRIQWRLDLEHDSDKGQRVDVYVADAPGSAE